MSENHQSAAGARIGRDLQLLRDRPQADVLIVGGGINGLAAFRDLALQGVDVALVERSDYCSGASAASSHMVHGGVRYLENGEFRLVRESVRERNHLLRTAPHYVKRLRTTVPIRSLWSGVIGAPLRFLTHRKGKPAERGAALIKIGLTLYDSFSRDHGSVPRHSFHRRAASLRRFPDLDASTRYTATYYDAAMVDPERLALDVLADGRAKGAHARSANYVEAVGAVQGGVRLRDVLSGEEFDFAARVVVNASGPWTDLTNRALGLPTAYLGGTKGSHIVLDHPELLAATRGDEIFFEHGDGRIVLIYPLAGRVLVGTTDLEHDMAQPIRCTEEEIDYFFDLVARVFPHIRVDRSHIVYRFAGVRPLPSHGDEKPGFVSRDYRIVADTVGGGDAVLLSLVGGKWTTFRALGESLADAVLVRLGRKRAVGTWGMPIGGGADFPMTPEGARLWAARHGEEVGAQRAAELLERYGTVAAAVIEAIEEHGGQEDAPLAGAPGYTVAEIRHLCTSESVVHLDDLLLRRTLIAFLGIGDGRVVEEVGAIAAEALGWSPERLEEELARTRRILVQEHGVEAVAPSADSAPSQTLSPSSSAPAAG